MTTLTRNAALVPEASQADWYARTAVGPCAAMSAGASSALDLTTSFLNVLICMISGEKKTTYVTYMYVTYIHE